MKFFVLMLPAIFVLAVALMDHDWKREKSNPVEPPFSPVPFSAAAYWERMEQAQLDILEDQKPVDQTVILWWGLDGLTLDENGELKWISRCARPI